jgi:hypothetical protein
MAITSHANEFGLVSRIHLSNFGLISKIIIQLHLFKTTLFDTFAYRNINMYKLFFLLLLVSNVLMSQAPQNPFLQKDQAGQLTLTTEGASHFAQLALSCIQKEYPNKLNQVLQDSSGLQSPRSLHPAFYGCFDWHSSVHGHWMLVRLLRQFPKLPEAQQIRMMLRENLSQANIQAEVDYLQGASKSWERMYGWSWLLKLADELYDWDDPDGKKWKQHLQPLTNAFIQRYIDFLPKQHYPVRTGVHPNTAFGLSFALDYARKAGHLELETRIVSRALDYYLEDKDCPATWEPSGEDFLSACLEEANLMRRILPATKFQVWFSEFLPAKKINALLVPAEVSDRSDPKLVHLDGVNLSRAWCLYSLLPYIKNEKLKIRLLKSASEHLNATLPYIASEYYEGTHWLASFAVYALSSNENSNNR